ncbi:uncharacterized protein LOC9635679 [Selaginella moellendorffii]|uniref:uncharacterized protein LOC9635679 n=1 Tax=Selaginella moellendorffii TaxID=88036 RepID=UPI000D1C279F|nr:uncharacterized protein LOC9635679 [Selaginella moellendorffii]|eukprot:XP_024526204.1 uncharacterized protein LOC9635679 [Selaginella moellendorffii]
MPRGIHTWQRLNIFGGMVQDGWALAFFCDAPDVPIVLEGQSLPFMDYLSNSLVKPREGNPVQFQALLLPSLKSQLQGLYDISACKLGDNVSLDGAPFQALLLQGLYNISACNIPLDGAQFQALLLPSSKLQMQELYNISARMLGDKAYLDGTRAAASMVQESDAFLVIGSTVMVLRLVSAAHKGKTRADNIACFEMECAGEVSLSMQLSSLFQVVSIHPIGCCPHKGESLDSVKLYNVGLIDFLVQDLSPW